MRWLKKILVWMSILVGLLVVALIVITQFYGEQVKSLLIKELQKNISCEIYIADIENDVKFSVFDNFPKASLSFNQIWSHGNDVLKQDTLFSLNQLDFLFDLSNIFNNDFTINEIHLGGGFIHLNTDDRKQSNYMVFKTDTSSNKSVDLKIEQLSIDKVHIKYNDKPGKQKYASLLEDFSSNISISESSTHVACSGLLRNLDLTNVSRNIKKLNTYVDTDLSFKSNSVDINKLLLDLNNGRIESSGTWSSEGGEIDYVVSDLPYEEIKDLVVLGPADEKSLSQIIGKVKVSGKLEGKGSKVRMKTSLSSDNTNYRSDSLNIDNIKYNFEIKTPNLKLPATSRMDVTSMSFDYNKTPFTIKGSLSNWSWLSIEGSSKGNVSAFKDFIDPKYYQDVKGDYDINFTLKSSLLTITKNIISKVEVSGSVANIGARVVDTPYNLKDFSGNFKMKKGTVSITDFAGMINQSDVKITGAVSHLFDDQKTNLEANIKSQHIRLEDLIDSEGESGEVFIPENIQFKITTDFAKMTYGKFDSQKVSGSISYSSKQLYFFPLTMNCADGTLSLRGKVDARNNNKLEFKGNTDLRGMNLQNLFYQMNNFSQDYVTDKHIRGKVTAEIETYLPFDKKLEPIMKDIYVLGKIKVIDGELIDNEMMMELSDFIVVDELKHIKFSEMENEIKIEKQRIYIPEMDINTNAMNVTLSGEQGFDETIDYHFVVRLSEVLAQRAKKNKKENASNAEADGSGIRLFLKMTGTLDDPKLSYDRRNMVTKLKEDIIGEKKEFKNAIINEIQSFKKSDEEKKKEEEKKSQDNNNNKDPEEQPVVEIEWDDEDGDW